MYEVQPTPDASATLDNGSLLEPLVTLKDGHGGVAHITRDDHCYVLCLNTDPGLENSKVKMTPWWFNEAFEAARSLPALRS